VRSIDREFSSPREQPTSGRGWLWFGVLGGAIAWLLHLLLAYGIAEFGCASSFRDLRLGGFSGVTWLEGLATLLSLLLAGFASLVAQRNRTALADQIQAAQSDASDPRLFMARSGVLTSRLFLFVIVVQSLPILYYLRECGT